MNFSINQKTSKLLSVLLVLVMMTTLFAGCKKTDVPVETSDSGLNLDMRDPSETTAASEPSTSATTAPVINENTAVVTQELNIRAYPGSDATPLGTIKPGERIEIQRVERAFDVDYGYILSPIAGWIVMDYVEMDIPRVDEPADSTTPTEETTPKDEPASTTTNIKAVVNAGLNIRSEASTDGKIQGNYNKGDVITILETKNGWGRTNKGWVKMEYVSTAASPNTNTTTNNKDDKKDTTISGNGSTTVQFKGIVTASELNVRADANQNATRVGSLKYGARVEILEKNGTWGRTKNGWISLSYVYQDGTTGSKTGSGVVTATQLHIRSGPGTGYGSVGSYNQGTRISILEQFTYDGVTWGCTNKGWVSLDHVQLDGVSTGNDRTGSITANDVNIRSGPGTGYSVVGSLNTGDKVTVLTTTVVDDITWGNIDKGWVSMAYVKLD